MRKSTVNAAGAATIAALMLLGTASCSFGPTAGRTENVTAATESHASPRLLLRAEQFRQATAGAPEIGFGLSAPTVREYSTRPGTLAARCALLNATEVYLRIDPNRLEGFMNPYPDQLRALLRALHRYRIRCYADLDGTEMFNEMMRGGPDHYEEMIRNAVAPVFSFNRNGHPEERFDGMTTMFLPHLVNEMFVRHHENVIFRWTDKSFGRGNENDRIMREAWRMMKAARTVTVTFPLGQYSAADYHDRVRRNELGIGTINDYFGVGDFVLLENPATDRRTMDEQVDVELKAAHRSHSVMIRFISSGDFYRRSSESGSLQNKSWTEITGDLRFLTAQWKKRPAFRGLAFDSYSALEAILSPGRR